MKEIGNLYDAGFKFIVTPGYKFETSIFQCQDKYTDAMFVLIDGSPNNGKYDDTRQAKVGTNTVASPSPSTSPASSPASRLPSRSRKASLASSAAWRSRPSRGSTGASRQGVAYANANLGTKIVLKAENVIYQGSFNDVAAGQQLAASMFDKGLKAIFCAAGGVGVGAISEAKTRAVAGKTAWIVGVDVDQFADGIYDSASGKSVILTSAMKGIGVASYDMIKAAREGKSPAGRASCSMPRTTASASPRPPQPL